MRSEAASEHGHLHATGACLSSWRPESVRSFALRSRWGGAAEVMRFALLTQA
jgi:hypothetical protein